MSRTSVALLLALVACHDELPTRAPIAQRAAPAAASAAAAPTGPAPIHAPTSGFLQRVAITDDGTAVVSVDDLGEVRLWPRLDGSAEPVVLPAPPPEYLAIGRTETGFLAGFVDGARGAVLLSLAPDGAVVARATVPADPAITQLVISGGDALILDAAGTLSRVAPSGEVRGRVQAPPRAKLVGIAARDGRAVAFVGPAAGPAAASIAWLREPLALGAPIPLSAPLVPPFALGPRDPARAGTAYEVEALGVLPKTRDAAVVAIGAQHATVAQLDAGFRNAPIAALAFTAPGIAVVTSESELRWFTTGDRPAFGGTAVGGSTSGFAGAGGIAVSPADSGLAISTGNDTDYLGYRVLGSEFPAEHAYPIPGGVALVAGYVVVRLDDALRVTRLARVRERDPSVPATMRRPIHVRPLDDRWTALVTTEAATPHAEQGRDRRLELLDEETGAHSRLGEWPALRMPTYDAATHVLEVATEKLTLRWRLDGTGGAERLPDGPLPAPPPSPMAVAGPAGRVAIILDGAIATHDARGVELWRRPVRAIRSVVWSGDGAVLVVLTAGGVLALDAATGAVRGTGCGWDFRRSHDPLPATVSGTPVVCEGDE